MWARSCALAAVLALLWPGRAEASVLRLFGFGGRSPAVAATGVATTDDYASVYLNPAGLAGSSRRVTLGALVGNLTLELDGDDIDPELAQGTILAVTAPLGLGGAWAHRVGLGVGMYVPNDTLNKAHAPQPGQPFFALLESTSQVIGIQVALGVRVNERLRLGGGVLALATLGGSIRVTTDAAGRFITTSEQRTTTQLAPIVGAQYRLGALDLGLAVRGVSSSGYDVKVDADLGDGIPLDLPPLRLAGTPQYDPLTVAIEAAGRPRPDVLVSGQLAYERWSPYPLPTRNPIEGQPQQAPAEFHDTVVPRLGAEWSLPVDGAALRARGGYAFVMTPAPEMTGRQSLLDNHRHVLSAGFGAAWPDAGVPLHVDAWLQAHLLMARDHTKDADAFDAGEDPPFASISTGGHIVVGGLTVGVDL